MSYRCFGKFSSKLAAWSAHRPQFCMARLQSSPQPQNGWKNWWKVLFPPSLPFLHFTCLFCFSSVGIVYKATFLDVKYQFAVQIVEGDWEMNEMEHLQREISIWQVSTFCSQIFYNFLSIFFDFLHSNIQVCYKTVRIVFFPR